MENELLVEFKRIRTECARKDQELRAKLETLTSASAINKTKEQIKENRAYYDSVVADNKKYLEESKKLDVLQGTADQKEYLEACIAFLNYEDTLCKKYNVVKSINNEVEPIVEPIDEGEIIEVERVTQPEVEKKNGSNSVLPWLITCGVIGAAAIYLLSCGPKKDNTKVNVDPTPAAVTESETESRTTETELALITEESDRTEEVAATEPTAEPVVEEQEEVVLPFETFGQFTNVNNEEQLRARAEWYYNTYIANANKSQAGAKLYTVEDIMNIIRNVNGEFMRDADGNVTYNDTDLIATANDLHTIANYDSFVQYGHQIFFTPMAPLFEDGSYAQKGAIDLDNAMEKVVAAIRAEDDAAFVEAAKEWGTVVINMFNYVDFNGEYVNIYQVNAPTSFALYHAMSAKYASTILEYSECHHISICIPYCTDYCSNEIKEETLSEIMYNINERALDAVAIRSGNLEEYEQNNLSLPEDLYLLAKDYFKSKYDLEIGYARTLK